MGSRKKNKNKNKAKMTNKNLKDFPLVCSLTAYIITWTLTSGYQELNPKNSCSTKESATLHNFIAKDVIRPNPHAPELVITDLPAVLMRRMKDWLPGLSSKDSHNFWKNLWLKHGYVTGFDYIVYFTRFVAVGMKKNVSEALARMHQMKAFGSLAKPQLNTYTPTKSFASALRTNLDPNKATSNIATKAIKPRWCTTTLGQLVADLTQALGVQPIVQPVKSNGVWILYQISLCVDSNFEVIPALNPYLPEFDPSMPISYKI